MNVERAGVVLRERSLSEVMDLALRFVFGLAPRTFARLGLAVLAPALAATLAARWLLDLGWFWVWLLAVALGGFLQGAFTIAAGRVMFSDAVSTKEAVLELLRRSIPYSVALVLSRAFILLGALFIVTLPFAWMRMLYVHEAVLLERAAGVEALRRSNRFVAHHARNAFGILLSFWVAIAMSIATAELFGQAFVSFVLQSGEPFSLLRDGGSPYALAGWFTSVPFVATARFLTYIDTRTRRDGWDIQIRFIAIEAAAAERHA